MVTPIKRVSGKIVSTKNDTIELNGYKYDARTGAKLGTSSGGSVRSMDGLVRNTRTSAVPKNIAPTSPSKHSPKSPQPSHTVHQKTIKSKTLMRNSVKKPVHAPKPVNKHSIQPRTANPHPTRVARATETQKHPHVSKFQAKTSSQPLPVKSAPNHQPAATSKTTEPSRAVLPLSPFDMALKKADSHQQLAPSKQNIAKRAAKQLKISTRTLSVGLGIITVLVTGGLFARQHMSSLAVQLAATRAGVEARLPGYQPAGFALAGPIEYSAGQITLAYQSNSDTRNFKVVQKNSDWTSQALLENFVQANDEPFQTVQENGKTIYIYDGNNATWVSGGIWYQVEGESSLNTDQLLRIASGL